MKRIAQGAMYWVMVWVLVVPQYKTGTVTITMAKRNACETAMAALRSELPSRQPYCVNNQTGEVLK